MLNVHKLILNVEIWMLSTENIAEEPTLSQQIQILSKHSICIGGSQLEDIKQQYQKIMLTHRTNTAFNAPCINLDFRGLDWLRLVKSTGNLSMFANLLLRNNYMSKCLFKPTRPLKLLVSPCLFCVLILIFRKQIDPL